jgi:hypothetical protein
LEQLENQEHKPLLIENNLCLWLGFRGAKLLDPGCNVPFLASLKFLFFYNAFEEIV